MTISNNTQQMPYTTGDRETWVLKDWNGATIDLALKSNSQKRDSHPLEQIDKSGLRWTGSKPRGYSGSFVCSRDGSAVEDFFLALDAAYTNNQSMPYSTATRTIYEEDGTISMYQLTKLTMEFENMGEWDGERIVEFHVGWKAQTMVKVS